MLTKQDKALSIIPEEQIEDFINEYNEFKFPFGKETEFLCKNDYSYNTNLNLITDEKSFYFELNNLLWAWKLLKIGKFDSEKISLLTLIYPSKELKKDFENELIKVIPKSEYLFDLLKNDNSLSSVFNQYIVNVLKDKSEIRDVIFKYNISRYIGYINKTNKLTLVENGWFYLSKYKDFYIVKNKLGDLIEEKFNIKDRSGLILNLMITDNVLSYLDKHENILNTLSDMRFLDYNHYLVTTFESYQNDKLNLIIDLLKIKERWNKLSFNKTYINDKYTLESVENLLANVIGLSINPVNSDLTVEDYDYMRSDIEKLIKVLKASNKKNKDILIWGKPGFGKTEVVKVITKNLGKSLINFIDFNDNSTIMSDNDELSSIKIIRDIGREIKNYVLLVDEAERLLNNDKNKAKFNNFIDKKEMTTFWVINSLENIEESFLRRFDYILEMRDVPYEKRLSFAKKKLSSFDQDGLAQKLAHNMRTLAEIESSIQWCKDSNDFSWKNITEKNDAYQTAITKGQEAKTGFAINVSIYNEKGGLHNFAGYSYIKEEVRGFLNILNNINKDISEKTNIPKGLLLMGTAGVGKSLLAKCIADEYKMNVVSAKATLLAEETSRIKLLFDKAKSISPCIIFLDEIDVLASNILVSGQIDTGKQKILNSLLVELDGFEKYNDVLVIGATHRSDILDPSILRSGRLGKKIFIRKPEKQDRKEIFEYYLKEKNGKDIDFNVLAKTSNGLSSVDIAEVVNKASIESVLKNESISQKNLLDAIDEIYFGVKTNGISFNTKDKWRVAIHEAGHALIAMKNGVELLRATVNPHLNFIGQISTESNEGVIMLNENEIKKSISLLLGGMLAEKLIFNDFASGNYGDLNCAINMLKKWFYESAGSKSLYLNGFMPEILSEKTKESLEGEIGLFLKEQEQNVYSYLHENKEKLVSFAKVLYENKELNHDEIKEWQKNNLSETVKDTLDDNCDINLLVELALKN